MQSNLISNQIRLETGILHILGHLGGAIWFYYIREMTVKKYFFSHLGILSGILTKYKTSQEGMRPSLFLTTTSTCSRILRHLFTIIYLRFLLRSTRLSDEEIYPPQEISI